MLGILDKVKKPSPAAARVLANIFSTECEKRPAAEAFDPTDVCVANPAKKKKKAFRSKPSHISVAVLPTPHSMVPRGKRRDKLRAENRYK